MTFHGSVALFPTSFRCSSAFFGTSSKSSYVFTGKENVAKWVIITSTTSPSDAVRGISFPFSSSGKEGCLVNNLTGGEEKRICQSWRRLFLSCVPIFTGRNSLKTADYGGRFSIILETSEYTLKVYWVPFCSTIFEKIALFRPKSPRDSQKIFAGESIFITWVREATHSSLNVGALSIEDRHVGTIVPSGVNDKSAKV